MIYLIWYVFLSKIENNFWFQKLPFSLSPSHVPWLLRAEWTRRGSDTADWPDRRTTKSEYCETEGTDVAEVEVVVVKTFAVVGVICRRTCWPIWPVWNSSLCLTWNRSKDYCLIGSPFVLLLRDDFNSTEIYLTL